MEHQGEADSQFGGQEQPVAVQGESDMPVWPEFRQQQVLDVAAAAVNPCDQIVGRRQRPDPLVDAGPDFRLVLQHLMQNGMNGRQFVFQAVLQFVDDESAVFFLLDQAL